MDVRELLHSSGSEGNAINPRVRKREQPADGLAEVSLAKRQKVAPSADGEALFIQVLGVPELLRRCTNRDLRSCANVIRSCAALWKLRDDLADAGSSTHIGRAGTRTGWDLLIALLRFEHTDKSTCAVCDRDLEDVLHAAQIEGGVGHECECGTEYGPQCRCGVSRSPFTEKEPSYKCAEPECHRDPVCGKCFSSWERCFACGQALCCGTHGGYEIVRLYCQSCLPPQCFRCGRDLDRDHRAGVIGGNHFCGACLDDFAPNCSECLARCENGVEASDGFYYCDMCAPLSDSDVDDE